MPLYRFHCEVCEGEVRRILTPELAKKEVKCKKDGSILVRTPTEAITTVMESIDTGMMPRKVIQPAGAPQLIEKREFEDRKKRYKKTLV